uniref:Chitin-binding type-1 domain-containing protein n=2 Tax=Spongospora subterranea TaxID=70186 RepID=A0A0H5R3X7_9EUKA|eukprot:CRZ08833.1 hypothetical protein [Spongospora subterranea]
MIAFLIALYALSCHSSADLCSNPPRADWRCGPSFGNADCTAGNCCSQYEWCGSTPAHCNEFSMCLEMAQPKTKKSVFNLPEKQQQSEPSCKQTEPKGKRPPITIGDVSSFNWCGSRKAIALAFEATSLESPAIDYLLSDLSRLKMKATFFLSPSGPKQCPTIRKILRLGHSIQHYSWSNQDMTSLTAEEFKMEMEFVPSWLHDVCNLDVPITQFSPPMGEFSHELTLEANSYGYSVMTWTVNANNGVKAGPEDVFEGVVQQYCMYSQKWKSAIIMHRDSDYMFPDGEAGILDIYAGFFQGFEFITTTECLASCIKEGECIAPGNPWPGVYNL